ncbi:MAG: hypothetical protein V4642_16450, partial [Bacteroidota bacterium]
MAHYYTKQYFNTSREGKIMKKIFLLIAIFTAFTVIQTAAQQKTWKQLPLTPYRGAVTNTAVAMDGKIYVTTNSAVYRSKDKGMTSGGEQASALVPPSLLAATSVTAGELRCPSAISSMSAEVI